MHKPGPLPNPDDLEILRRNEERLRRAETVAQFGYWEFLLGEDTVRTSDGARRIYGLDSRTWSIKDVQQVPLPEYRPLLDRALKALVEEDVPYNVEFKIRRFSDGELRDIHSIAEYDREKRIVFGVINDITERKRAEEALKESEKKFRQLAENIDQVFWLRTPERFLYVSPAYETSWGRTVAGLLEDAGSYLDSIHAEDRERIAALLDGRGFAEDSQLEVEFRILHPQAGLRWIWVRSYPILDEQGALTGRAGIAEDITERKTLTEKMIETQKLADIGTLAAGVAHEINNPLQVITGIGESLIQFLEDEAPLPEGYVEEKLNMINRNAWRIAEIIHALNLYAHTNNRDPRLQSLNRIIADTLLLIEHQLLEWKNIQINLELDDELPALLCDRNNITQILLNLLTNARDAMPGGGEITIATRVDAVRNKILLSVRDTGVGIPPEIAGKVFLPFFTTKPVGSGTGLGLPVVLNIVRHYGGSVEITSAPGAGTTVEIRLPLGTEEKG